MVRIEIHDTEQEDDPLFTPYVVDVPESATGAVAMWRDQDTAHLSPELDPGLWKATVVELVQLDLTARITAVLLVDGSVQRFAMPETTRRKLKSATGTEEVRRRIVLDAWSSHVLRGLQLAPTNDVWKLQHALQEARTEQDGATARLQEATENACRLKEMAQGLRLTLVGYLKAEKVPDMSRIPLSAVQILLKGLDTDIEAARVKLGDLQAAVEFKRRKSTQPPSKEVQQSSTESCARRRKGDLGAQAEDDHYAAAEADHYTPASSGHDVASDAGMSDPEELSPFMTPDHSSDDEEEDKARDSMSADKELEHSRQVRDAQHRHLENLLQARAAVQTRAIELAASMRSRAKQRFFGMFSRERPSQLDRLCLSHESLFDALEEAKLARNRGSDSLCELLHAVAAAEAQVDVASKSYATEIDKMQQQVIRRDSLTRRDSFSEDEDGLDYNAWHKATQ